MAKKVKDIASMYDHNEIKEALAWFRDKVTRAHEEEEKDEYAVAITKDEEKYLDILSSTSVSINDDGSSIAVTLFNKVEHNKEGVSFYFSKEITPRMISMIFEYFGL